MSVSKNPEIASNKLQWHLESLEKWLNLWCIKVNETKSLHITFSLKQSQCPTIYLNGTTIPQANEVKCLRIHMEKRLTWQSHIWEKNKLRSMYWLLCNTSKLSLDNKLSIYKVMLKPIWTFNIWTAFNFGELQQYQTSPLYSVCNPKHLG